MPISFDRNVLGESQVFLLKPHFGKLAGGWGLGLGGVAGWAEGAGWGWAVESARLTARLGLGLGLGGCGRARAEFGGAAGWGWGKRV